MVLWAATVLFASGCAVPDGSADRAALTVFAASSLTEAFTELEILFEQRHPGADARISFAGSQILRIQIEEGAPADVFASADPLHVSALVDAGLMTGAACSRTTSSP